MGKCPARRGGPGSARTVGRGGGRRRSAARAAGCGGGALAPRSSAASTKADPADPARGDAAVQRAGAGAGRDGPPGQHPRRGRGPVLPALRRRRLQSVSDRPDGAGRGNATLADSLVIRPSVLVHFNLNSKEKRLEPF